MRISTKEQIEKLKKETDRILINIRKYCRQCNPENHSCGNYDCPFKEYRPKNTRR